MNYLPTDTINLTLTSRSPMQWPTMAPKLLSELIRSLSLFLEQTVNQGGNRRLLVPGYSRTSWHYSRMVWNLKNANIPGSRSSNGDIWNSQWEFKGYSGAFYSASITSQGSRIYENGPFLSKGTSELTGRLNANWGQFTTTLESPEARIKNHFQL